MTVAFLGRFYRATCLLLVCWDEGKEKRKAFSTFPKVKCGSSPFYLATGRICWVQNVHSLFHEMCIVGKNVLRKS